MYSIRKKFNFEGAHILSSAYSKECKDHIHGHSYIVEVFISANNLNEYGMVIDFKKLTEIVNPIIKQWDHALLVHEQGLKIHKDIADIIVLFNPTAENMAKYLFELIYEKLDIDITQLKIRVHETAKGYAEYKEKV